MTQEWSSETVERWVAEQVEAGRDEWTVSEIVSALASMLPVAQLGRRSVYQICQQYVGVMGVQPRRRARSNFSENVFTAGQVGEILLGVQRRQGGSSTYAEVFAAMRDQQSGKVTPEPAPTDPATARLLSELQALREEVAALKEGSVVPDVLTQGASPELLAEVRALRGEIAQLSQSGVAPDGLAQGEVSALLAEVRAAALDSRRGSTLSGDELWRLAMVMMNLSAHDGELRLPDLMNYLGVRDPAAELERARQFGMDEVLSR